MGDAVKSRRVLRYQCDFCPKSGCGKGAIAKHERRCFANPGRVCPICRDILGVAQQSIDSIIAAIDACAGEVTDDVRDAAAHCPACITAAIVQRRERAGANVNDEEWWVRFDYKDEMSAVMNDYHNQRAEHLL